MKTNILHIFSFLLAFAWGHTAWSQCNNSSFYLSAAAPTGGGTVSVAACMWAGEYSSITGVVAGQGYTVNATAGTYITVRHTTSGGTVVITGTTSVSFTAPVGGTYYIHFNTNAACGTNTSCRTLSVTHVPVVATCNNGTNNSSIAAPAAGSSNTIACMQANQYYTLTVGC